MSLSAMKQGGARIQLHAGQDGFIPAVLLQSCVAAFQPQAAQADFSGLGGTVPTWRRPGPAQGNLR